MDRERKAGRGSLMETYVKGFNVAVMTLVGKTKPPRAYVSNGNFILTSFGNKINGMYEGHRRVTGDPNSHIVKKHGRKSKAEMGKEYNLKLKQLQIWIDTLVKTLPDEMPDRSPVRIT